MMFRALAMALVAMLACAGGHGTPIVVPRDLGSASPTVGDGEVTMTGTGAAFMVIANGGTEDDVLLSGETDVAQVVEVHEMADVDGVMEMHPLTDGLSISAGGEETLEPGGYHIMLIGLREDLTNGKTYDLTLHFQHAGEITVPVTVRPRAGRAADATPAAPVSLGDITISDAWSRPAPATGLGGRGTPEATPHS